MKRRVINSLLALGLSAALILPAAASGDTLISRSYLENTYRPRLSSVIRDSIKVATQPLVDAALGRMDQYFTGPAGAWRTTLGFTAQNSARGDALTLASGAGLSWVSGTGTLSSGVLIDATAGREVPSGGALTAGHRYIADGETKISVSSQAQWLAEGTWMTTPGGGAQPPEIAFTDVPAGAYYADAVTWAVGRRITNGVTKTTFEPDSWCTRGQIVTFLWRAYGQQEPRSTRSPFTDVNSGQYWYKAVLWAVEQGITTGVTETTFAPDSACTRGQAVTFLWRAAGTPAAGGSGKFSDVPVGAYYAPAVAWAVREGIATGVSGTVFGPDGNCTRGHIVTFLYRDLG